MSLTPAAWRRILDTAVLAPSGDNLQPWVVQRTGDTVLVTVDPARDRSLYNFRCRASLIAIGAAIENIDLAARESGFSTKVEYLASGDERLVAASMTFQETNATPDPLFRFVSQRCTNRKPYRQERLAPAVLAALQGSIARDGTATLRLIEDEGDRRVLARAASLNDRLLFELRELHDGLFETLRWTEKEAEATRDGLFVKTLELGPMGPGFRAMRSWAVVKALNTLGASRMAPRHSFATFMRSAAFGFLQMADASPKAFVEGGRHLQRIWLTASSLGLSVQPMAGMLYMLQYLPLEGGADLNASQRALVLQAEGLFKRLLPLEAGKAAIMLFRVGYGQAPSATSLRRSLK